MSEGRAYEAEFEALGEVEVHDRVERGYYSGGARAYAMRWLNDRAMARLTGASFLAAPVAAELAILARKSRQSARWAMVGAAVAGLVTVANISYASYAQIQVTRLEAEKRAALMVAREERRRAIEIQQAARLAATPAKR
jgi:hypothetical protein